jgi:hypothetical protein
MTITVRRIGADEARDHATTLVQALADVLIDCVEGGASVSFMLPLAREKALDFWHGVLQAAAQRACAAGGRNARRPHHRHCSADHRTTG